mgnify:CR=1 FL=1
MQLETQPPQIRIDIVGMTQHQAQALWAEAETFTIAGSVLTALGVAGVTVRFTDIGRKTLRARYAKLTLA